MLLLQPYLPMITFSLHKDYIVKNLCENRNHPERHCNGCCQLKKMVKQSADDQQKAPNLPRFNPDDICAVFNGTAMLLPPVPRRHATVTSRVPSDYFLEEASYFFHPPCQA